MSKHFLLRIGDTNHFTSSSTKFIWGVNSKEAQAKWFIDNVKVGDLLWFVKSKSKGKIIAVSTFTGQKERVLGPLIDLTLSNKELGWTETTGEWDTEVHYKDLYNLNHCELYSEIKGARPIRFYNDKCKVNLPDEYVNILRYSKITKSM